MVTGGCVLVLPLPLDPAAGVQRHVWYSLISVFHNAALVQELLAAGFTFLATATDVGLLGEAAAKNAAVVRRLRGV